MLDKNRLLWYALKVGFFFNIFRQTPLCGTLSVVAEKFLIRRLFKMSDREWVCSECGVLHDRDVNAAINILNFNTVGATEINACGQTVRPKQLSLFGPDWLKQEAQG